MNEYDEMNSNATHARLLDVAIEHFGRFGIEGASTRAIAKDAETPMSSITYHFGGKEGLYLATAERIADRMQELLAPAIGEAMRACQAGCTDAQARAALHSIYGHATSAMVSAETEAIARFIVREQAEPTEAFTRIYERLMAPMLGRFAFLLRVVAGDKIDEHEARLRAMALFGQVLFFRVARETALRGAGWKKIGASELAVVKNIIADHLDAVLDRLSKGQLSKGKGS
jgi:TetR/AcrR family transcriptional regulator, regulator of cefoperazone and chloramphenicol sensitivity